MKRFNVFMPMTPPELVRRLTDNTLLVRTGVVLVAPQQLPEFEMLAVQWGADPVDIAARCLERVPVGARFLGLSQQILLRELDSLATSTLRRRCALVANADLLLARLPADERHDFWDFLFSKLKKRPTALLLLLPDGAEHLFSPGEADRWRRAGRLSRLNDKDTWST